MPTITLNLPEHGELEWDVPLEVVFQQIVNAFAGIEAAVTPRLSGNSSSSLSLANGDRTFIVEQGLSLYVGQFVRAQSKTAPAAYMAGTIKSYTADTMVISVTEVGVGTASYNSWAINIGAPRGSNGTDGDDAVVDYNALGIPKRYFINPSTGVWPTVRTVPSGYSIPFQEWDSGSMDNAPAPAAAIAPDRWIRRKPTA